MATDRWCACAVRLVRRAMLPSCQASRHGLGACTGCTHFAPPAQEGHGAHGPHTRGRAALVLVHTGNRCVFLLARARAGRHQAGGAPTGQARVPSRPVQGVAGPRPKAPPWDARGACEAWWGGGWSKGAMRNGPGGAGAGPVRERGDAYKRHALARSSGIRRSCAATERCCGRRAAPRPTAAGQRPSDAWEGMHARLACGASLMGWSSRRQGRAGGGGKACADELL